MLISCTTINVIYGYKRRKVVHLWQIGTLLIIEGLPQDPLLETSFLRINLHLFYKD